MKYKEASHSDNTDSKNESSYKNKHDTKNYRSETSPNQGILDQVPWICHVNSLKTKVDKINVEK